MWVAGVDGCRAGWLVVFARPSGGEARVRVVASFAEVLAGKECPCVIAVDIPIGLPYRVGRGGRTAEGLVRPFLRERQSSVFSVPSRPALAKDDYHEACALALATSDPPRKISKQLFMIRGKIQEVDTFLRNAPNVVERVFEVHPELAFWRLNSSCALNEPKKRKARCHEPGLGLRRRLLIAAGFPQSVVYGDAPAGAAVDDLLDALACAAIARRIHAGLARSFPDPPERDAFGLPMAIWA